MDLLENVAQELEFEFHLYIVSDGVFGSRVFTHSTTDSKKTNVTKWNGIVGDLVSGAAHMSFAALSVSSVRSEVIDYSVPFFFSGVSFLAAPTQKSEIPLLAFLLPFSPELWIAIFTSLNITAMAVAVYEWLSPFGLNPWGRQRSKNFSIASALWVMWGLLCGHLVAFKAPKSWPNKFLINVWGGFSVIFVASYTANIAALIAGLFFHNAVSNYHDRSLLSQRVGAPRASAADYYVHRANLHLWEHMQKFYVRNVEDGIQYLKNGTLDILIADTPILDYYRATDHGCKLQKIGDAINEDTYAVGMTKGFPLKDSISAVIAKYSSNGYMDILQEKWYGALPCFKLATDMVQPRPLGVAAVAGVFILLGLGMVMGCLILLFEHLFYRYTLPILRHKPKGTIWRSRNIMFFSQKLYRFINCVELVSPHHAARELVHTIRQGQITSLFQKSVKRKEHEQRRRRKSKAQFFEMIQEIRRVQQEGRDQTQTLAEEPEGSSDTAQPLSPIKSKRTSSLLRPSKPTCGGLSPGSIPTGRSSSRSPYALYKDLFSPRANSRSPRRRRFSSDMIFSPLKSRLEASSSVIGRRLSKDSNPSPPDLNSRRGSHFGGAATMMSRSDRFSYQDVRYQGSNLSVGGFPHSKDQGTNPGADRVKLLLDVGDEFSVGARLNNYSSRMESLSSSDLIAKRKQLLEKPPRSRSPIPSLINLNDTSSRTVNRFRDRVRSENNGKDANHIKNRPRLRTPSPPKANFGSRREGLNTNATSTRSKSLENHSSVNLDEEMPSKVPTTSNKLRTGNYESIIQVNVTCFPDDDASTTRKYHNDSKMDDSLPRMSCSSASHSPLNTLRKTQMLKRRQSHQQRLESQRLESPPSPVTHKDFLVPIQRHETPSSKSPTRKRHLSQPTRGNTTDNSPRPSVSSSSLICLQEADMPSNTRNESDDVFDDIPPPPPPPFCHPRNNSNDSNCNNVPTVVNSPLERLNKDELVDLWRSSESELRSHLLRAIRAKEVNDPP